MLLLSDLPNHLLLEIFNKSNPINFIRLLRTCRHIHKAILQNKRQIRIQIENFDYDISPPSRRRQLVCIYENLAGGEEQRKKILFPKNFDVFLSKTIPDLAFFLFDRIIFPQHQWEKDMTRKMIQEMKRCGLRCKKLINESPILLEETIEALKPRELSVLQIHSIIRTVDLKLLNSLVNWVKSLNILQNFLECVPVGIDDLIATISGLQIQHLTIWAHGLNDDKKILVPFLMEQIKKTIEIGKSGKLDLYFSEIKIETFLLIFNELECRHLKDSKSGTNLFLFDLLEEKKLAVILFEDFNEVIYTFYHSNIVRTLEDLLNFYRSVFNNELAGDSLFVDLISDSFC